jgi:dTDP-4-dehydrorhamnose 3,5-epimerase
MHLFMNFSKTRHPEVLIVRPQVFYDTRGYFMETFQKEQFHDFGIEDDFVQDNQSSSSQFTLRGLHYQVKHTQGKLVRVVLGEIFDVAVDLRQNSPNFGVWVGVNLSEENKEQLWIPPGFAHGFLVLSERADVVYKTTDYYDRESERCIRWDDPDLNINWPLPEGVDPLVSEKDAGGNSFANAEVF